MFLIDPLRLIGEEHGIAVKGDADLLDLLSLIIIGMRIDDACRKTGIDRALHILLIRGKKQIHPE